MCLPEEYCDNPRHISVPRMEKRNNLAEAGLVGKIEFNSDMNSDAMKREICRVFSKPMGLTDMDITNGDLFPFQYLQRTGAGSRTLCIPSVSSSFTWSGRQVASLAKSGGLIYIMAESSLPGLHVCCLQLAF